MNQYQSISDLKDRAKEKLTGKFGNAALMNLSYQMFRIAITFAISSTISIIAASASLAGTNSIESYQPSFGFSTILFFLEYALTVLCNIFNGVFHTGFALFFLNIASKRPAFLSNMFYGFQHLPKQSLTISAANALLQAICLLPYQILYFFYRNASGSWEMYMILFMVLGMIVYAPLSLCISQSYFLLLDFPSRSGREILQMSVRLMRGHKKELFLLQLSFLPLMLLGTLSFGIGNLWVEPYMQMALALYFLDIMKPAAKE